MITLIKTVRTVAGDKAKTLVLPIALSCADSLLHMGMFAVMIAAIINLVAGAFNAELLAFYSGALIVLFVVRAALYATNYAQTQFRGADITADLRLSIGNHLRRLNLGYFDKNSIGQLASVLTTDVSDFEQTITTSLASFFKVVCFSVLACAFAFAINWLYGLIILAIVVASLPLARLGGRAASKGGVRYRESVHAVISRIIEYINGIKTFRLYNLTGRRFERLDRSFADLKRESIRMELSIMPFSVLFSVATSLIVPLGLVAGTLMFMDGQLDAPRLIAAVMIAVSISSMMTTLGVIYPELNYLAKAAESIERIQAERPLAYRDGNPRFTSFDVRFDDVRFGYADGKEVLHGVTFTAQPGTRTALVGPSGSGKTTVISLISRFWDASSGSVRVGGHEVRDIAPDALAEQVAVVFQDVYLLADTVANNIRVGKRCFFNYNCVFLDGAPITFGDDVWVGPNCSFVTPLHPLVGRERAMRIDGDGVSHLWERDLPITVGDDVWIASNVTVNPGVTIGEGAVIGSGSVVTKDVPSRTIAFGNPCRVARAITEDDSIEDALAAAGLLAR